MSTVTVKPLLTGVEARSDDVNPDLSGHILYGHGPWGPGPVNVRGRGVDGRVWAAVATPSGAIADPRAPWFEVPPTWGPLADLLRIRAKSGLV